ncbi:MAG: SMC family ATPase, partial [Solirubrobacteraceae bacterium]|nr:SMC family ATPase [Solirubrobacteraceae bacterium]
MRIHRLILEGIGPYATRQELDFDELTANGLFLFTGPTGAGKTTILDAVVFALYGTVPGARGGDGKRDKRARERIVSDLRTLDTQPKVELEFSAGGRRFVVIRSPDHERPKTRGDGTTVAKASATLEERIGEDWVPRSTDFYEISAELQTVVGMNAEQFAQVVLLPQGEFAGFLRASVGDRRKVLERLFQVDRYQSAEDWFKARADEAKVTLQEARSDLEHVVERLTGALGDAAGPDEVRRGLTTPDEIASWIAARGVDAEERVERARHEAATRKAEHAAIDLAHVRAAQLAELTVALEGREEALAEHAARLPNARKWMAGAVDARTAQDDAAWEPAARAARGRAAELSSRVADEQR